MPDENTSYLKLPLPHPDNLLEGDVFRLRDAFVALDAHSANVDAELRAKANAADVIAVTNTKADATSTTQALQTLDARISQVAVSVPKLNNTATSTSTTEAATANAVKIARDEAWGWANAAQVTATAAQGTANTAVQKADAAQNTANTALGAANTGAIPRGIICLWSGAATAVPVGWALCDGGNASPDLRDRFVVAAGGKYAVGAKGGAETQNISASLNGSAGATTLSVAQMPSHVHGTDAMREAITIGDGRLTPGDGRYPNASIYGAGSSNSHTHSLSGSASGTVSVLPPYYALAYIMKL